MHVLIAVLKRGDHMAHKHETMAEEAKEHGSHFLKGAAKKAKHLGKKHHTHMLHKGSKHKGGKHGA